MSLLEKSRSVEISRRTQPFFAKKQTYSLGQQIQIEIDTQREFIDFENSRLHFSVVNAGGTTVLSNKWTAGAFIKNLRVKTLSGQMIGHEQREYRGRHRFLKKMGADNLDARTSYQDILEGALGADDWATARSYAHKLDSHIFNIKEYYPAHFHQGLIIEIDLADNAYEVCEYGSATPGTNTIGDIYMVVDLVQLKPEIENEMVRMMEEQKLFVDYVEWLEQSTSIAASTAYGSFDVVGIDGRVKSAFQFAIANRDADGTDDYWGDDDAAASGMGRNGLTSYRFRLGSRYLNYSTISVAADDHAEAAHELLKALDMNPDSSLGDVQMTYALRDTAFFGVGVKVDKAQRDVDEVISSQVDKDRNNLRVELVGTTPAAGAGVGDAVLYTYVKLDKRLQLLPGSIVRNIRS